MKSGIIIPFIGNNNLTNRLLTSVLDVLYYPQVGRTPTYHYWQGCLLCLLVTPKWVLFENILQSVVVMLVMAVHGLGGGVQICILATRSDTDNFNGLSSRERVMVQHIPKFLHENKVTFSLSCWMTCTGSSSITDY